MVATAKTICANCWRETQTRHILCPACEHQLDDDLTWFEHHLTDLDWRTNRMDKTGNGGGAHGGSSNAPLREHLFELLEGTGTDDMPSLRDTCCEYARCLNLPALRTGKLATLLSMIRLNVNRNTCKATPVYARLIHALRRKAQQTIDYVDADQIILGECPTTDCHHIVRAMPTAMFAPKCPDCGQVYPVSAIRAYRRVKLLESHITGTQTELRRLLKQCGIIIKPATLRSWVNRGELKPATTHSDARKREYRLSDVYRLAVHDPERETTIWMLLQNQTANQTAEQETE